MDALNQAKIEQPYLPYAAKITSVMPMQDLVIIFNFYKKTETDGDKCGEAYFDCEQLGVEGNPTEAKLYWENSCGQIDHWTEQQFLQKDAKPVGVKFTVPFAKLNTTNFFKLFVKIGDTSIQFAKGVLYIR